MTAPFEDVPPTAEATPNEPLQFDNAEYAGDQSGRLGCAVCRQDIDLTYYEVNGKTVCQSCRTLLESQASSKFSLVGFARAAIFGTGAAIAGAMLYYGVAQISGYEIGLVSIAVGAMVGVAVRAGSRNRGGLVYQILAIFLGYSAIGASYLLLLPFPWWPDENPKVDATTPVAIVASDAPASGHGDHSSTDAASKSEGPPAKPMTAESEASSEESKVAEPETTAELDIALFQLPISLLIKLGYQLPIDQNMESPIGFLIIGFGLWEAWKLNRRTPLVFNGPFSTGGDEPAPPKELPGHA